MSWRIDVTVYVKVDGRPGRWPRLKAAWQGARTVWKLTLGVKQ